MNTITTAPNAFMGLAELDTTILSAAGALAVDDCVGFKYNAADGKVDFVAAIGGSVTTVADLFTPVIATWMHLGFRIEQGRYAVPFINGVMYGGATQVVNGLALLPNEELAPTLALTGAGTVRPTLDVDWCKCVSSFASDIRS